MDRHDLPQLRRLEYCICLLLFYQLPVPSTSLAVSPRSLAYLKYIADACIRCDPYKKYDIEQFSNLEIGFEISIPRCSYKQQNIPNTVHRRFENRILRPLGLPLLKSFYGEFAFEVLNVISISILHRITSCVCCSIETGKFYF